AGRRVPRPRARVGCRGGLAPPGPHPRGRARRLLGRPRAPLAPSGPGGAPAVITVVVADGHAIVRSGVRLLLDAEEDLQVVAEAEDVRSAIRQVQEHKPMVLILDPGASGDRIGELSADTNVVVLTMQNDPAFAREALRAGALGYVLKEAADTQLVDAVRM